MRRVTQPDLNGNTYIDAHHLQPGDHITLPTTPEGTTHTTVHTITQTGDHVTITTTNPPTQTTVPWNHPVQLTTGNQ